MIDCRMLYQKLRLLVCCALLAHGSKAQLRWPPVGQQTKPWARWWWQGSAVNTRDLDSNMHLYKAAGLGGLEITPIYGVQGADSFFVDYLSPKWVNLLNHTLNKAKNLGLGLDMANGTGWPFGAPWVDESHASKTMVAKVFTMKGGDSLRQPGRHQQAGFVRTANNKPLKETDLLQPFKANANLQALAVDQVRFSGPMKLEVLMAYPKNGQPLNLTHLVDSTGKLYWKAPAGDSLKLFALFSGLHGKMVERAAPGGEGYAIDHFSGVALDRYLSRFDTAFRSSNLEQLRAFFNDSYEVDDAQGQSNWTPQLLEAFRSQRGYDLLHHLPALLQHDTPEAISRVLYDYRATIDSLLLEQFTTRWRRWAHVKGKLVRNQSHGSPANILDLYAAVDIPETEGNDILRFRFASSAAHVTGKKLVSAEAATWLNEHFLSGWGDVKKSVDQFFLGGVNHIFYHGVNYSPPAAPWPGWLFYAATHFTPANPQWQHFPALNNYVTRCQSFLQAGRPDNDLLVYFPIADRYSEPGKELLQHFDGMERNWEGSAFTAVAHRLQERGFTYDFISDRQLQQLAVQNGTLASGGNHYKAILLPGNKYVPLETLQRIMELVKSGAKLLVFKDLPQLVPGWNGYQEKQQTMASLLQQLTFETVRGSLQKATLQQGSVLLADSLDQLLHHASFVREEMTDRGLQFTRLSNGDGHTYFIVNTSSSSFEGWVPVVKGATANALFDPASGNYGWAKTRKTPQGTAVWLQLPPGASIIVRTYGQRQAGSSFPYVAPAGKPVVLSGKWQVDFLSGGPHLPAAYATPEPGFWTEQKDSSYGYFSGVVAYTTHFTRPTNAPAYLLELGHVAHTAEVFLNGQSLGVLTGPVYQLRIPANLLRAQNKLTIEVANLMANRIRYMDLNRINWKIFYNINMSAKHRENLKNGVFDASHWPVYPSGLAGPVLLTPLLR